MKLPLRGRGESRLIGVGDGEPDPHSGGTVTGHRAEDEERAVLPRYEPDIDALPAGEALFQLPAGRVLERRRHGTDGNCRPIRDDLNRVRQVRVLVLEMQRSEERRV